MKRGKTIFLYKKNGLLPLKTIVYILIAIGAITLMFLAVASAKNKIFG